MTDNTAGDTEELETQEQGSSEEEQGSSEEELQQTFDRGYVEQLRSKSANYRLRAKESEQALADVQQALFRERVQRLDLVVDPVEVPYSADLLEDETALVEHIEALLTAKPYLRKRAVGGDIGQHDQQQTGDGFSLLGALRANAG